MEARFFLLKVMNRMEERRKFLQKSGAIVLGLASLATATGSKASNDTPRRMMNRTMWSIMIR